MILNPWRAVRERDERIAELEAEAARQKQENDDVWTCYVLAKRMTPLFREEEK